ncbi:hypothetical protein AGMMS49957_06830 [Synergistales bacterium]|nr:hypothetical protein AGMMS49957_06830 [Synergistales bacterium]
MKLKVYDNSQIITQKSSVSTTYFYSSASENTTAAAKKYGRAFVRCARPYKLKPRMWSGGKNKQGA